jgi:hypothetical protein
MASDMKTIKATCLCGDAAHDITLPSNAFPIPAYFCSCNSCRHMTGTLFLSSAFLTPNYQPSSDLLEKLTSFKFSERITTYFCKRCGCTMLSHCLPKTTSTYRSGSWDVMTGTLETFDGILDLKGHEYIHDTLDGGFSDFLPALNNRHLERWSHDINGETSQLPLYWRSPEIPKNLKTTARLHAHCKCNNIRFYIARPSPQSSTASRAWPDLLIPHYTQQHNKPLDAAHETWYLRANKTRFLAGLCSCNSCRLASGQEITAWAFIPAIDISLDAEGQIPLPSVTENDSFGSLQTYASSTNVTRSFCSVCGAIVFFSETKRSKTTLLDVAVGLLEAPEGARAESWLEWRTERLSFREDAVGRAGRLVEGIEKGMREFREKGYGRSGPAREVSEVLGG